VHPTALIPTWFGLALGVFGIWPSARMRDGASSSCTSCDDRVVAFLGGDRGSAGPREGCSAGLPPDEIALASKLTMAGLMLLYVILCVAPFIARGDRERCSLGTMRGGWDGHARRAHGRGREQARRIYPRRSRSEEGVAQVRA